MKTIILAGGLGTRLSEYNNILPKPMVSIFNKPILLRIMNIYSYYDYSDFIIALGYKAEIIKKFFNQKGNEKITYDNLCKKSTIELVDTGIHSMTGGRLKRLKDCIGNETFMLTYGDGVSDINIQDLVEYHQSHNKLVTVTAVRPPARFGSLNIIKDDVLSFEEKNQTKEGWINGGFFVMEPEVFDFIYNDATILEREPLEKIASNNEMKAFKHEGYWQCMDTKRDLDKLEEVIKVGNEPWKK